MKLSLPGKIYRNLMSMLLVIGSTVQAETFYSDWEIIFEDDFSASSFTESGTLNWGEKWNKIAYLESTSAAWRIYQSRDDALVTQGSDTSGTEYVTLKGAYGDYTSQNDQTGANDTFACGGIFTNETFTFQYGYVEVRAQFESANGCWPAIWLMPKQGIGGWPACGEIDIMEHVSLENQVHHTLHFNNNAGTGNAKPTGQTQIKDTNGWHTYGMNWTKDDISFYVDGKNTLTISAANYTNWPFSREDYEFYLMIDQQIGGSWAGNADSSALAKDSVDFNIDYVRVYSNPNPGNMIESDVSWGSAGPVDADGKTIIYTPVDGLNGGNLNDNIAGSYQYTVSSAITSMKAPDSHIHLQAYSGTASISMADCPVEADSLYITDGKYTVSGSATINVGTLILDGGSMEISSATALKHISKIYLGMETDTEAATYADRNASLYFKTGAIIRGDIELIDNSKIAVYQGNTLDIVGNVKSDGHTLNLVGVNSDGTATIKFSGRENSLSRVSIGVAELGFSGVGQVLDVRFAEGAHTNIGQLLTNSPNEKISSLHIENGGRLTISKEWTNSTSNNAFNFNVEAGGTLNIGNGTDIATAGGTNEETKANKLAGVVLTNKGTLNVNTNATMDIGSLSTDASALSEGSAQIVVSGTLKTGTLNIKGGEAAKGCLTVQHGASATIDTLNAQGGQVEISITGEGSTASIGSLTITGEGDSRLSITDRAQLAVYQLTDGLSVNELNICNAGEVSLYAGSDATTEAVLTVQEVLTVGAGKLNADLVLADGAELNYTGEALEMGSSITINGTLTLSDEFVTLLNTAEKGSTFVLATSMDGFITGDTAWSSGDSASLEDYFSAENITLSDYTISYELEDVTNEGSGKLVVTKTIPEPGTATLSLLALAALAARRRR